MIMKQKTITTDKATLLVVEVEQGATDVCVKGLNIEYCIEKYLEGESTVWYGLPQGNWQLIGRMPDITEEQASKIVDRESKPTYTYEMEYPEYVCDEWWYRDYQCTDEDYMFSNYTAVESLYSFLQANEVYFENPIPPFKERFEDFKEAQSKVWDKERCFLFLKIE